MLIKRIFKDGKVDYIKFKTTPEIQRLSLKVIEKGTQEGWLIMADGLVTIKSKPSDVIYRIKNYPGVYCCHCGISLSDGQVAKEHVRDKHEGVSSPDQFNPSGYRYDNFFECKKGG